MILIFSLNYFDGGAAATGNSGLPSYARAKVKTSGGIRNLLQGQNSGKNTFARVAVFQEFDHRKRAIWTKEF